MIPHSVVMIQHSVPMIPLTFQMFADFDAMAVGRSAFSFQDAPAVKRWVGPVMISAGKQRS